MSVTEPAADEGPPSRRQAPANLTRLAIGAAGVAVGLAVLFAGIPWLIVVTPRWVTRGASIGFLWSLLGLLGAAVPATVLGGGWSCLALVRAWRRHDRAAARRLMRWVVLAMSGLVGLVAMELVSGWALWRSYEIPDLPTRFPPPEQRSLRIYGANQGATSGAATGDEGLYIVVVGESSALGQPYDPKVSIGPIVAWQLERVFPGRRIAVDVRARGGLTLGQAMGLLRILERRPDAIIVFSGHNEILTRFGWPRAVRHYAEEGPESPLAWLELARAVSSAACLILDTLDRQYGEAPPPPHDTRALVDHPICTPKEYASTREGFRRYLDALAAYCGRIGALPILIVPASNDGAFEPNRSVLAAQTPPAARAEFERAFRAARDLEATDPPAATAAFRRLVDQHPEFAEAHYRLARLLAAAGAWEEARPHFVAARDLDAATPRCPTDFRDAIREVGHRRGAMIVDCETVFEPSSTQGVLDDHVYHDAHHPNLLGIVALAQDILEQLHRRRAWGWPASTPVPRIDPAECARHFGIDSKVLATLCERSADWYGKASLIRHDPKEREAVARAYAEAGSAITAGRPLPAASPPSLGPVREIAADSKPGGP